MKFKPILTLIFLFSFLFSQDISVGAQTHFGQFRRADMDSISVEAQLDLCLEAGINMIRDECLWSDVETDSGIYNIPPEVDRYVRSAISRQIKVYLILNYNNTFYATSNGSGVTSEANRIAYAKYCKAIVSYFYPLGVKHYEIWNEPNHGVLFWTPQPNANDYTALLHTAYDSIKTIASDIEVIGCATTPAIGNAAPFIEGLDFIRDVFAAGGGDYMDAVSFHLYQVAYRPENEFASYINSIKSYVGDKPIYFSEFGYPTHNAWPNISLEVQARYITRMFLKTKLDDQVKAAVYYDLKNDGTVSTEAEHNFGILNFDRSPKPAFTAIKVFNSMTHGARPENSTYENGVYRLYYDNDVNVLWSYSGSNEIYHIFDDTIKSEMPENFIIINMLGDTIAYHMTQSDSIKIEVGENPIYCCLSNKIPEIRHFSFQEKEFLLYPGETIKCSYIASDTANSPIILDPSAINWAYTGTNGNLENDLFTSESSGEGEIIAEIQGIPDTIKIHVIDDPGHYTVEHFSDTSGFHLESTQLNFDNSELNSDGSTLNLSYEFTESSASVYLYKNVLISHHADSIYLDLKTDDKELEFRLYCIDANGQTYTLGMKPKPTDWTYGWGTVSGPMSIPGSAVPPIYLEKIYLKIKPVAGVQTGPYTGSILFDNLRLKKGNAVSISSSDILPEKITLSQNYPNPFNGISRIQFQLPCDSHVRFDILDLKGSIISTQLNEELERGEHSIDLDMHNLASGIYIYRLSTGYEKASRKFVYIK